MAVESAVKTGFPGIWIHGKSIRVDIMHKGTRHCHTTSIEPTKRNLRHAIRLRTAVLYAIKAGAYNEVVFFAHSRPAGTSSQACKTQVNDWHVPSVWSSKWRNLKRRAEVRAHPLPATTHLCVL